MTQLFSRHKFIKTLAVGAGLVSLSPLLSGCTQTTTQTPQGGKMPDKLTSNSAMPDAMQRGVDKNGWRIIGPGGGGAQYIPTIKPDDPQTVLVACDMTGSYITRNGGQTWRETNLKVWVRAFAFDPSTPTTVYAGGTGLYRSDDCGSTWRLIFPNPNSGVKELAVGDHADHSYAAGDNWPVGKV